MSTSCCTPSRTLSAAAHHPPCRPARAAGPLRWLAAWLAQGEVIPSIIPGLVLGGIALVGFILSLLWVSLALLM